MIVTLEKIKNYLRVDYEDDDSFITSLIETAEEYLYNATGNRYSSANKLAVLYCKTLVYEWYKDRNLMLTQSKKEVSEKIRYTLQSILLQLKLGDSNG